jgi:hypothetical protein
MKDLRCLVGLHAYVARRVEGEHGAHPQTYPECERCGHVPGGLEQDPLGNLGGLPPTPTAGY